MKKDQDREKLEAKIKELEGQVEAEKSAKLYALADFQNFKKRLENEKNDYRIFATKMIVSQLMQITDDYARVRKDVEEKLKGNEVSKDILNSIQMLNEKIIFVITQNGFEEIKIKEGDKFDPETMEALTTVPVIEKEKDNTVILVDQKGFKHIESGIVFKTAKVIIGKLATK